GGQRDAARETLAARVTAAIHAVQLLLAVHEHAVAVSTRLDAQVVPGTVRIDGTGPAHGPRALVHHHVLVAAAAQVHARARLGPDTEDRALVHAPHHAHVEIERDIGPRRLAGVDEGAQLFLVRQVGAQHAAPVRPHARLIRGPRAERVS